MIEKAPEFIVKCMPTAFILRKLIITHLAEKEIVSIVAITCIDNNDANIEDCIYAVPAAGDFHVADHSVIHFGDLVRNMPVLLR